MDEHMSTKNQYWLAVGRVSDAACSDMKRMGGHIMQLHSEPPVTLVGIAFDSTAHPDDLAFNNGSEIQIDVHSTGLSLVWMSSDRLINAAYSSLTETSFITYAEYEDILNGRAAAITEESLPDIEARPF
jgi:hypothetical protein